MTPEKQSKQDPSDDICVWICEDHFELRLTVAATISMDDGLVCPVTVGSVEELLHELNLNPDQLPAVILLDLGLPGMGGLEGIGLIRNQSPQSKIVVFTVANDADTTFEALEAGVDGYLLKDESYRKIPECLREVVLGGSPMSPSIVRMVLNRLKKEEQYIYVQSEDSFRLSDIEKSIILLCSHGLIKKEISEAMAMSYHRVDYYIRMIFKKMSVSTIHGAVGKAFRDGIIVDAPSDAKI